MRAPAFPVSESGRGVQANLAAIAESRRRGPRISWASLRPQRARCACHDETRACVGIASRGPSEQNESALPQSERRADMLYRRLRADCVAKVVLHEGSKILRAVGAAFV